MKRQTIFAWAFVGCCVLSINAAPTYSTYAQNAAVYTSEGEVIHFRVDQNKGNGDKGYSEPKAPVRIPTVTLDGHTLHFITPCEGLTLQLVRDGEVCYDVTITSDYVELPADITGVFELQILRGAYVFFAEVEL